VPAFYNCPGNEAQKNNDDEGKNSCTNVWTDSIPSNGTDDDDKLKDENLLVERA
jgi:hypothetical protein